MAKPRWMLAFGALWLAVVAPTSAGWAPVGGPGKLGVRLQLDPGRPELLYARVVVFGDVTGEKPEEAYLWRSENAGATWRSAQTGLGRLSNALAIDPLDPKVIWVWTPEGELWRSGDAGKTWSRRFATPPGQSLPGVIKLLVDARDPATLFRVDYDFNTGTRVAVSHDAGASFHDGRFVEVPNFDPGEVFFHLHQGRGELVFFNENGLDVSTDDGRSWSRRGRFRGKGFVKGLLAPSEPDTLYGIPVAPQCLVRSDDTGAHWQTLAAPRLPASSQGCYDVAVDPKDARHVWVADQTSLAKSHLFESRDGGQTWSGPLRMPATGVVAAGGEVLYAGSVRGEDLYVSTDGGRTWKWTGPSVSAGDARSGFVAKRRPGGGSGLQLFAFGFRGELFRSNGGKRWVKLPLQAPSSVVDSGGSILVAVAERGVDEDGVPRRVVFRSEDSGRTWNVVASAPPEACCLSSDLTRPQYLSLQAFEANDRSGNFVLWTSDDSGATWHRSSEGLPIACQHVASLDECIGFSAYVVDPFDATRRWVASDVTFFSSSQVFISTDAGASWHVTASPPSRGILALAADPRIRGRVLAGTYDGLFVTKDGGEHWLPLGQGLPASALIRQLVRDARSAAWYAATTDRGIYRSLDGGSNWELLDGAPDLNAPLIAVDPSRPGALLAAFGDQGLWRWTP